MGAGVGLALGLLANLALAMWLGGILSFSFVTTPILFRTLDREEAGRALRAIFPSYYRIGAVCGGIFVAAMALHAVLSHERRAWDGIETILGSVMLALTLYAWRGLLPRVESARVRAEGSDPTDHTRLDQRYFKKLHRLSVRINASVMLLGLLCLTLRMMPM